MIYFKSLVAGVIALLVSFAILLVITFGIPLLRIWLTPPADGIGVVVGAVNFSRWPVVIGASIIFASAFVWKWRRTVAATQR